jgi:hypothetical protein
MTRQSDFDAFVQRQQELQKQPEAFNPDRELRRWRQDLTTLYKKIEGYLKKYVDGGAAAISYAKVTLNEEFAGTYEVQKMRLSIGPSIVTFTPVGTMLIGARGRVDVQGPHGRGRLVLIGKDVTSAHQMIRVTVSETPRSPRPHPDPGSIEWIWKISTLPPEMKFIDLTEDTFFDMILAIANG